MIITSLPNLNQIWSIPKPTVLRYDSFTYLYAVASDL